MSDYRFAWRPVRVYKLLGEGDDQYVHMDGHAWLTWVRVERTIYGDEFYVRGKM